MPENYLTICIWGITLGVICGSGWLYCIIKLAEEIRKGNRK